MTTVFIVGSTSIGHLDPMFKDRIDRITNLGLEVIVGDADGADTAIQTYLHERGASLAAVYCSGSHPRNNVGGWPVHAVESKHRPGTRAFFMEKGVEMARTADYGVMMWDVQSTGILGNVIELLRRKKKSLVFVNKTKTFKTVGDPSQLGELVSLMSIRARLNADEKIRLSEKIDGLRHDQTASAF